jgi:outer membrane lipopolysaccharide assembly protein LptE/RlpB
MRFSKLLLLFLVLAATLAGCAYSFRGQTAGAIKSIAIPTFENETAEFGIAERVTEELVRGFQRDGTLRITSTEQADAVLSGRITRLEDMPYTARADQTVEEYRFSMTCEIELTDNRTQQVIWTQTYPAWAVYPYTGSLEFRDQAIQEAVSKLQQDLLNRIVGSW